jgi:hypothetical protein
MEKVASTGLEIGRQVTVKTESGVKTKLDYVTRDPVTGEVKCVECKATQTAPLTKNQAAAFPEIEAGGGVIVGAGKPGFPGGTRVPIGPVDVRRGN